MDDARCMIDGGNDWSLAVDEATVTEKLAKQAELFAAMRGWGANRRG